MLSQKEKIIPKYMKLSVLLFPVILGTYPTLSISGENATFLKTIWMLGIYIISLGVLFPLVRLSLKTIIVDENGILIKGLISKKQVNFDDIVRCFFKADNEILCLYLHDTEKKISLGAFESSNDIVKEISKYIIVDRI